MLIAHTARALGFLSRFPVPAHFFSKATEPLSASVSMFPVAGVLIAIPATAVLLISGLMGIPEFLCATLTIASLVILTGGLHEDGLADIADGFFGANDPVRRLEIMKDSAIGTYGALALGLSVLLRIGCIVALLQSAGFLWTIVSILGVAAASRAAVVWLWSAMPSARAGGLSDSSGSPSRADATTAVTVGAVVAAVAVLPGIGLFGFLCAGLLAGFTVAGFQKLCENKIGGQTGDTLGAVQQLTEISLLLGLVIAL